MSYFVTSGTIFKDRRKRSHVSQWKVSQGELVPVDVGWEGDKVVANRKYNLFHSYVSFSMQCPEGT
jgi:hypothetical protein